MLDDPISEEETLLCPASAENVSALESGCMHHTAKTGAAAFGSAGVCHELKVLSCVSGAGDALCRLRLVAQGAEPLEEVILRTGKEPFYHRTSLQPLDVVDLACSPHCDLSIAYNTGGQHRLLVFRAAQLRQAPGVVLDLSGAADVNGKVVVESDSPVKITARHASSLNGGVQIVQRGVQGEPEFRELAPAQDLRLQPTVAIPQKGWNRLIFYAGPEVSLGCGRERDWRLYSRDGRNAVVLRSGGRLFRVDEGECKSYPGAIQGVSHWHATIRRSGSRCLLAHRGAPGTAPEHRVVVNDLQLDPGWNSFALPAKLTLGQLGNPWAALLSFFRLDNNSDAVCGFQCIGKNCVAGNELFLWVSGETAVWLTDFPGAHGLAPALFSEEARCRVYHDNGQWLIGSVGNGDDSTRDRVLRDGIRIQIGEVFYNVDCISRCRLILRKSGKQNNMDACLIRIP